MLRVTLRNIAGHKLRLLTTGLAVVLGVAFISGTLVLGDTVGKAFDDLVTNMYEHTDAVVRAEAAFEAVDGMGPDERGRIPDSLVSTVRAVDGVAIAQGDTFGYAQLVDKQGEPIGNPQAGPPAIGANWSENDELNMWRLVAGREPRTDDEIVVDRKSAEDAGYVVGDTAQVLVQGPPQTMRISGIAKFGEAGATGGATVVMFTPAVAQRLSGQPGMFDSLSVTADDGVSQGELVRRISAVLPDGVEAVTGDAITKETQDQFQKGLSVFNRFMLVFAVVALLVGGFMVFNTFFITVAQRTRENALLRAVGASRRQILLSVMLEALGIGLIASVLGLVAGIAVAAGLKQLLEAFGFDLPATGIVFTSSTAIIAMVAGLVVTVTAAVSPARKAGKIPPVAAMRDVAVGSTGYGSKERILVGAAILTLGVAALLYGLFGSASNALPMVGLGVLLVFFGVSVLGRTVALPLSRVIGWPIPRLRGIAGGLARENAMRNPKRTATTASALMIGVGLVSFITIFAASTKQSFSDAIDKQFAGDAVITSKAAPGLGGLDPALTERINRLPEVEAAGAIRFGAADVDGKVDGLVAADPETFEIFDVGPLSGSPADLGPDSIAVHKDVAKDKHLAIGDTVPVLFKATGRQNMTVAMIYRENVPAGDWMLGISAYEKHFADQFDFQVFVRKAPGVPTATAMAAVQREVDQFPGAKLLDQSEYKAEQTQFVDQMLGLVYALLGLAILIALLGIGNTLALSILERTRELGVLRAVGMTRQQLRSSVRWESVIIAVQGTVLGLVVGVFFGWALVKALDDEGISAFAMPWASLAVVVVLAALAGVAAAILPARRAAKLDVLRAIVSE